MEILLSQFVERKQGEWSYLHKKVNSDLTPIVGHFIEDVLWEEGSNEIVKVELDLKNNSYFITMKPLKTQMPIKEYVDMAKYHGWLKPGELEQREG